MYAVRAEWKKFCTFREVYVGLGLTAAVLLLACLPQRPDSPADFWNQVYNFNFNVAPFLILFLQVAGLSRLFCWERERRTEPLLRVSRRGISTTCRGKLLLGLEYGAASSLLPGVAGFLLYTVRWGGIPDPFQAGDAIARVPLWEVTGRLGLWGAELLFSLLGGLCAAGAVMLLSAHCRRPAAAMAASAVCLSLPALSLSGLLDSLTGFAPLSLLSGLLYRISGFSWHSFLIYDYQLVGTRAGLLWRPVLYGLCLLGAELVLTRLIWGRRARR